MIFFSEFYIIDKEEIKNFISLFAINAASFDYDQFLDIDIKETKKSSLILPA